MEIVRSAHRHPLLRTGGENEDDKPVVCYICKDLICGPRFSCFTCKSHFHESCTDLPPRLLDHPLHPRHPLSLIPGHALKRYICDACDEEGNGFVYRCSQCRCNLHIRCGLSVDREGNVVSESSGEKDYFRYELHQHLSRDKRCKLLWVLRLNVALLVGWALILAYTIGGSAVARGISPNLVQTCT